MTRTLPVFPPAKVYVLPFLLLLFVLLQGCSSTKSVPDGDALFYKYKVQLEVRDGSKPADEKAIKTEMAAAVRPKPNSSFLGLRPGLWFYNAMGKTKKEKGLRHWLKNKLGQPPVLFSQVDTSSISGVMFHQLHNRGYFGNTVTSTTKIRKKKAITTWTATVKQPYRIRKLQFPQEDSLAVFQLIRETQANSLLKIGDPYNLQVMMAERERIDDVLKEKGYYHFSPDLLYFRVDSTEGDRQVDVYLTVKQEATAEALRAYTLNDIYIYTNYSLSDTLYAFDTIRYKNYFYIPNENYVRARYLLDAVFLEQGQLYSRSNHRLTSSRLTGLGTFKYVQIKYSQDTLQDNLLDVRIYLTQAMKKSLRLEAQAVTKTNNFAGPGFTASFRNRNALKGSELLTVNLVTSFESQVSGRGTSGLNSYEIGLNGALHFPRFVAPVKVKNLRTEFSPVTTINLGFSYLSRVQFFQMNSYTASYAYSWKPKRPVTHKITPINLNYVQLGRTTEEFDSILQRNTFLQRSFEQQFIVGTIYDYIYNTQVFGERKHHFYFNFNFDQSGLLTNAFQTLLGEDKPTEDKPRTLAGQPYSQYSRLLTDFRYYFKVGRESKIASRLILGAGLPYGNSTTLPYVKQFSIGGTNSIRAFRARSVGPGTYKVPDDYAFSFFDQTGELKLETNVEYRFPISGFFKGALFVDAGNIWLMEEAEDRPGGEFIPGEFLNQLAVGTGFGLRVDVEFFVLRFDFGIPVRVPYNTGGSRTVIGDFRPGIGGDNGMILNIAIGYPF